MAIKAPTLRQTLSRVSRQYSNKRCGTSSCTIVSVNPNENCPGVYTETKPYIASSTGQANPVFENPFHSFSISKPDCCTLTVVTDCGTITIPETICDWSSCDLSTDVRFTTISLELDPDDAAECMDTITVYVCGTITQETDPPEPCPPIIYPFNDDPCAYERSRNPCCPPPCPPEEEEETP